MLRTTRAIRMTCVLGAAALVASGCGGDPALPAGEMVTPIPGSTMPGSTVAVDPNAPVDPSVPVDPNAPVATDPATGLPAVPAAPTAPTATVPSLVGDDTSSSSGFESVEGTPLFVARAASGAAIPTTPAASDRSPVSPVVGDNVPGIGGSAGTTTLPAKTPVEPAKPTTVYTGARIFVDGMIHAVQKGGTFPKGAPVFRLVSVSSTEIEIELVAGEFTAGGGVGTVLDKGDLVSMVNASEQVTYRLKFLSATEGISDIAF